MKYLPIQLVVTSRRVLVVGGGEVAHRKASVLARAGAHVEVVAPAIAPVLRAWVSLSPHVVSERAFESSDVVGATLVVAATGDAGLNAQVSAAAQAAGVPVNVVDQPALCTFVMPALVDRAPILVGVSSAGAAPVLARTVRARIDAMLPPQLGALATLLGRYRDQVKARFDSVPRRRAFWEHVLDGPVAERVYAGDMDGAEQRLRAALSAGEADPAVAYLVAAGPGSSEWLTLQGQRCLQRAEHVYYAEGVPEGMLELARRDAPRTALATTTLAPTLADRLEAHLVRGERVCWLHLGCLEERDAELARVLTGRGHQSVCVPGLSSSEVLVEPTP